MLAVSLLVLLLGSRNNGINYSTIDHRKAAIEAFRKIVKRNKHEKEGRLMRAKERPLFLLLLLPPLARCWSKLVVRNQTSVSFLEPKVSQTKSRVVV